MKEQRVTLVTRNTGSPILDVLNNIVAPDNSPTPASTIDGTAPHNRVVLDVSNAAIYWQVKTGDGRADADWRPANGVYMSPGSRRLPTEGLVYGVRFWAATPTAQLAGGPQARVTAMVE